MRHLLLALIFTGIHSSSKAQTDPFETCQYFRTRNVSLEEQLYLLGPPQIVRYRPTYTGRVLGGWMFDAATPVPTVYFFLHNNLIIHTTGWFSGQVTYVLSGKIILKTHGSGKAVKSLPDCVYTKQMAYLKGKGIRTSEKEAVLYIEENGHYSIAFKKNLLGRYKAVAIII